MKSVCIIPARGGSKRIPRKNIKDFLGKPLIAYSIENALKSEFFEDVIVSTDDEEIARVAKKYGASVPFLRDKSLADDFSSSGDAVAWTLQKLQKEGKKYDFCCTIYATAPLLQIKCLKKGLEALLENPDAHMAFSVTSMPFPIQRTFKITKKNRCKMFTPEYFSSRSQDLEEAYQDAGQFYWKNLHNSTSDIAFGEGSIPVILPRHLVQDIDTLEDWQRTELLYKLLNPNEFDSWNKLKQQLNATSKNINIKNGNIYLLSVGKNIANEIYGKGEIFLRPVLVLKKLGHNYFFGVPLTSKTKVGNYFFEFTYKGKSSYAMFNQARTFTTNRVLKYHGKMKKDDFQKLKNKFEEFLR